MYVTIRKATLGEIFEGFLGPGAIRGEIYERFLAETSNAILVGIPE